MGWTSRLIRASTATGSEQGIEGTVEAEPGGVCIVKDENEARWLWLLLA